MTEKSNEAGPRERPILFSGSMVRAILDGRKTQTRRVVKGEPWVWLEDAQFTPEFVADPGNHLCPHGLPGDRLWVREAYRKLENASEHPSEPVWYMADGEPADGHWTGGKPSIHMPRWASRITLEITGVRVERLWAISEDDAAAEGWPGEPGDLFPVAWYEQLWEDINGVASWAANPWVWVVEFRRLAADERQQEAAA